MPKAAAVRTQRRQTAPKTTIAMTNSGPSLPVASSPGETVRTPVLERDELLEDERDVPIELPVVEEVPVVPVVPVVVPVVPVEPVVPVVPVVPKG